METDRGIIDEIRRMLYRGARLRAIDSTEDELILVFRDGEANQRFRLDAKAVEILQKAQLIEEIADPGGQTPRPEATV